MSEFLQKPEIQGIIIGGLTFLIIGAFHPLVIKAEYYFGTKIWWAFLAMGIIFLLFAYWSSTVFMSAILAILGFSSLWSILEIKAQAERVRKGWFPKNPKRHYNFDDEKDNLSKQNNNQPENDYTRAD